MTLNQKDYYDLHLGSSLTDESKDLLDFDPADLEPGIHSADELPAKLYFRIGEVAKLTGLKQHVLRYWESEFPAIAPKKMGSNHRMYRRKDVEFILQIKHLLYEKRYTIEGARKFVEAKPKPPRKPLPRSQPSLFGGGEEKPAAPALGRHLKRMRSELQSILKLLRD